MPTSPEFVALCRSQVMLLTQALGASLSVVYLAEEFVENAQPRLTPIVAYPDLSVALENANRLALLPDAQSPSSLPNTKNHNATSMPLGSSALMQPRQLVMPLMHEGMVLGVLMTERDDRAWTTWERSQVERIADTLSLACVMDQRAQWLEQSQQQNQLAQSQQHDVMDNLLHQLRSPLTALRTFGKLLAKRLAPGDSNRAVADSIVQQTDRLQELLQQFDAAIELKTVDLLPAEETRSFGASRSESRQPIPLLPAGVLSGSNLELEACSISEILQPLVRAADAIAQEKDLKLTTVIPDSLPSVLGNLGALREVLSNLVDNALKYTPSGGEVQIRVIQERSDSVIIGVSDNGLGIPAEDLPHLFERHYRGVQAQGEIPGTGLGLAIARRLVEQMNGSIQVLSPVVREAWIGENLPKCGTSVVVQLKTINS